MLLTVGCVSTQVSNSEILSSYAARASWQWQSADNFLVRGRARLDGRNQLFSGPFVLWASKGLHSVRADFSGPDGSVLLSLLLDSSGCLVYQPHEAQAYFVLGGIPFDQALLDVNAMISLIRTGYPSIPEQWKIVVSADTSDASGICWSFSANEIDSAFVVLRDSNLFPSFSTDSFALSVSSTSWHDSFNAWPMAWIFESPSFAAVFRYRSIDTETKPSESVWALQIPVAIDTISASSSYWLPSFYFPVR